jgi:hypothetical protein
MLKINPGTRNAQMVRLDAKSQDHQLKVEAVAGTGMSPWEAEVLLETVKEIYHSVPGNGPMVSGQVLWTCVSRQSPHGKPLEACEKKTVALTVHSPADRHAVLTYKGQSRSASMRMHKICRITEEALDQGGVLSQEDLAELLFTDVRTVRRNIAFLRKEQEITVRTRGVVHDIGPSVTHKGKAIELWLDGQEPVEVARSINHSLKAVERYLQHFSRCVFLRRKGFTPIQIAMTVGISSASANEYLTIYQESKNLDLRLPEIDCIGAQHFAAEDEKKGVPTSNANSNAEEKQP